MTFYLPPIPEFLKNPDGQAVNDNQHQKQAYPVFQQKLAQKNPQRFHNLIGYKNIQFYNIEMCVLHHRYKTTTDTQGFFNSLS